MERFGETALAQQAYFIASKVGKENYQVDTLMTKLKKGEYKVGPGTERYLHRLYSRGKALGGLMPVLTDDNLLLHDNVLYGKEGSLKWKAAYEHYVSCAKVGCVILARDLKGFITSTDSDSCLDEVHLVPDGRLFAIIDDTLVTVMAQKRSACPTVSDGEGKYGWADGSCFEGQFRGGKRHGHGTDYYGKRSDAPGGKYVGEFVDDKRHGHGTYYWANGCKYVGEWVDNKRHGIGT